MNANLRNFALWVIIVLLLLALFTLFQSPGTRTSASDISFSQLLTDVDQGRVRDVTIQGPEIHGTYTDGRGFNTYAPNDTTLVQRLYGKGVQITARPPGENVPFSITLTNNLPTAAGNTSILFPGINVTSAPTGPSGTP